jgi:hypothetical protein
MYINITHSETSDNKGSSGGLVHYLDKENRLFDLPQPETWFTGTSQNIPSNEVRKKLDDNIAKLGRDDAKFFLININPSQKELAFLKEQYGDDVKIQLKAYAIKVMDEYAKNFNRPGVESNKDLLWFAKLENHRYYSHKDKEVKNGTQKRGDLKPGEQMHIQVIVSRKDITNKIKLSPMNKSRGRNAEHSKKLGQFDRAQFAQSGEKLFDQHFSFERKLEDTFQYAKTQKNGTLKERMALHEGKNKQQEQAGKQRQSQGIRRSAGRAQQSFQPEQPSSSLFRILMGKGGPEAAPIIPRKKKRKKVNGQDQELTL